ncbi:MAG: efflux RND transporter periplasmic adaptor subunit, partial [Cyanobacteria bacterium J149]
GQSKDDKTMMMAHQVPIQVQGIQGQDYQVTSGIQEGDRIITNRILDLRDKTPISLQEVTSQVN